MAIGKRLAPLSRPRPIDWLLSPLVNFLEIEAAGGILLLACTVIALVWANSPWSQSYYDFWHTYLSVEVGSFQWKTSLEHFVNDGLMVIFFFVVGLEIKRELLVGELRTASKAAIPIAAAVGGMALPALIYIMFNREGEAAKGWAIPCATDIAFALGIMAMLGKRVPVQLKVFLTALAIVDDIGAVVIIALFYTYELSMNALGVAALALVALTVANVLHIRRPVIYAVLGIVLWLAVLKSGVHATVAGVLLAFTIPAKFRIRGHEFVEFSRKAIEGFARAGGDEDDIMTNEARQQMVHGIEMACERVQTPAQRLEYILHPWSSFLIVPIFALANAGLPLGGDIWGALTSPIALGIGLGLILGKQIGVTLFTWLAVKLGLGQLAENVTWKSVYATSWLAGIGFTMSLFIANLGFGESEMLETAKLGVLAGSLVAGVVGFLLLRAVTRAPG